MFAEVAKHTRQSWQNKAARAVARLPQKHCDTAVWHPRNGRSGPLLPRLHAEFIFQDVE